MGKSFKIRLHPQQIGKRRRHAFCSSNQFDAMVCRFIATGHKVDVITVAPMQPMWNRPSCDFSQECVRSAPSREREQENRRGERGQFCYTEPKSQHLFLSACVVFCVWTGGSCPFWSFSGVGTKAGGWEHMYGDPQRLIEDHPPLNSTPLVHSTLSFYSMNAAMGFSKFAKSSRIQPFLAQTRLAMARTFA